MEEREPLEDRIFGFLWRWFWRIMGWGIVAALGLVVLYLLLSWADDSPQSWGISAVGGLIGWAIWHLSEVRRLLIRLVEQNERFLAAKRLVPDYYDE